MRLAIFLLAAIPAVAQFRSIEIRFRGTGCASCVDSLPERLRRLRGVESAAVDAGKETVELRLAAQNRVRLEQVRDLIEQDGTKALAAKVEVAGEISESGGEWSLAIPGVPVRYRLESAGAPLAPGVGLVVADATALRPDSGAIVLKATRLGKVE